MLQAGAAQVNITPYLGCPMAGYSARDRGSESVHDELFCKALVLESGGTEVALVTSDLIGIGAELAEEVRRLVSGSVGIPANRVWICGSHTHFGPEVRKKQLEEDVDSIHNSYLDVLAREMASAVRIAHDGLRKARIGTGTIDAEAISYNRRLIRKDKKVEMSLTLPLPYEELTFGPVDPEVTVFKVVGETDDDVIASVINFACHPVSSTDHMYEISADYPGYAMDLVEQTEGGVCLFALGCAGNIVPIQRQGRSKRQVGLSLGGTVLKALQWIEVDEDVSIRAVNKKVDLPLRLFPPDDEMERDIESAQAALDEAKKRDAEARELKELSEQLGVARSMPRWAERHNRSSSLETEIQVFWIGNTPMIGLPGEIFVELGMEIKKRVGSNHVFVASLSNDSIGYVPIRQAYEEGGYESTVSPLAPGCGEHLVEEVLALAESIRG
jgi:neutral ceramidase